MHRSNLMSVRLTWRNEWSLGIGVLDEYDFWV
jgi:hypothetical protein